MARLLRIYILFSIVFLCGSCGKKDNKKDHIQEVSARISPILDTISLDYAQYVNYRFQNYTRENIVFYIYHFSRDSSLYYNLTVICNATTGRVDSVHKPRWHVSESGEYIPTPEEKAMYCAVKGMLQGNSLGRKQITRLRAIVGAAHKHEAQKPEILSDAEGNK